MTTIQIRIDEKTKKSAQKVLDDVGMDMSSAVKVYLKQIIIRKGIPFRLLTENGFTEKEEQEINLSAREAAKGVQTMATTSSWKEDKAFLDSLKRKKYGHQVPKKVYKKVSEVNPKNAKKG